MKKVLLTLTLLVAFFGMTTVYAAKEEVNLKELENDSMIIGNRLYDTNYLLSLYDIVAASSEYAVETGEQAPIYVYVVDSTNPENNYIIAYTGPVDDNGVVPMEIIEDVEKIYPGSTMDATAINNSPLYDYIANVVEVEIMNAVDLLNNDAADRGFESITYDKKTNTGTFTIADLTRSLADYKDSGIVEYFLAIAKDAKAITYKVDGKDVTVKGADLTSTKVIEIAYVVLNELSGNAEVLNYESVANKKASATITFEYDGFEYTETFTVEFVYDVEEVKDVELGELAEKLNETAKENGFESITYDEETKTGTFTIADLTKQLADYKDSGIVEMFITFMEDAESITYTIAGEEKTITKAELTSTKVIEIAYNLLNDLSGNAEVLNYESVANKKASATVTYKVNGETITETYTVEFVYDIEEIKDKELSSLAGTLNETAEENGFESITYDKETKTGTFTIADLTKQLADYKDSGIVEMFITFMEDAESITYTIAGEEKTITKAELTSTKVIEIAYNLLNDLSGNAEVLNYESVANKKASATVTYKVNGETITKTYTVEFVYDIEEIKDEELSTLADTLNETAEENGFESITYDEETKTGTFTIADLTKQLADYKDSGIVEMFITFMEDAESITYTIAGEEKTITKAELTSTKVIEIAYNLLNDLSGNAEVLNYESVANKKASATVTYKVNGETITKTYTVEFVYDIEEIKDEELSTLAGTLNETAEENGFESITYDEETKTGTFTILDGTRQLADYKDSGIVEMFITFMEDAESITYTIAGEEKTITKAELTSTKVIEIAYNLLNDLAGEAEELNYAAVAGKDASATVTYKINGETITKTYTVSFVMAE